MPQFIYDRGIDAVWLGDAGLSVLLFGYNSKMEAKIQAYNCPPNNYDLKQHATNGVSHLVSPAQLTSYLLIPLIIAVYFSSVLPIYYSPILLSLFLIATTSLVISASIATLTDPTDRCVYYYKWSRLDRSISFQAEYEKILFCEYCDSYCWANSKHCRVCNRCVNRFDHHCIWFNNCVGQRNYRYFFVSIVSAFCFALVVVVHVFIGSFKVDFSDSSQLARIIVAWIIGLVLLVFGFLLMNLIILHIYLNATDQTTYQFLQRKKKEEQQQRKEKKNEQLAKERQRVIKQQTINHIMPVKSDNEGLKHQEVASEGSMANTKVIMIQENSVDQENIKIKRKRSKKSISNELSQQEFSRRTKKEDDESNVKISQQQLAVQHEIRVERRLPSLLRNNKSATLLISQPKVQNPSKKKLEPLSEHP